MSTFAKITIFISVVFFILLSSLYFYLHGLEKVYFIDETNFNPAPKSYFINPLSGEQERLLQALSLLKTSQLPEGYSSEVPNNIVFNSVRFENDICYINISFKQNSGISGSFHEDRMLLSIFKTIKEFKPETEKFKIDITGAENPFKHISTRYYMTVRDNNISITSK